MQMQTTCIPGAKFIRVLIRKARLLLPTLNHTRWSGRLTWVSMLTSRSKTDMKKIIAICTVIGMAVIMPSCKKSLNEFLEKAPGVDVDENIVFSSKVNVDAFVSSLYEYGMFSIFPNRQNTSIISNPSTGVASSPIGTLSAATDEGKNESTFQ